MAAVAAFAAFIRASLANAFAFSATFVPTAVTLPFVAVIPFLIPAFALLAKVLALATPAFAAFLAILAPF